MLRYPPFTRLAYLGIIGRRRDDVLQAAGEAAARLRMGGPWEVLGPSFYPVARVNDEWRIRIAVKMPRGGPLREFLRANIIPWMHSQKGLRLAVNVDP